MREFRQRYIETRLSILACPAAGSLRSRFGRALAISRVEDERVDQGRIFDPFTRSTPDETSTASAPDNRIASATLPG